MNINPASPGIKTSEFKLSVIGILLNTILTFLAVRGFIKMSDIDPIINGFLQIAMGISGVFSIYGIIHSYIESRTSIKTSLIDLHTSTPSPVEPVPAAS